MCLRVSAFGEEEYYRNRLTEECVPIHVSPIDVGTLLAAGTQLRLLIWEIKGEYSCVRFSESEQLKNQAGERV